MSLLDIFFRHSLKPRERTGHNALFGAMVAAGLISMANTQALANSFKTELLNGHHAFGTSVVRAGTGADTWKAALYLASATVNKTTTAYSATGEASGTGYTAGGVTVTNGNAPTNTADVSYWTPSASFVWSTVTLTAVDACLIYNSSQSNKAMGVYTYGSQSVTAGTFTLTMPTNDQTTGLLRIT